MHKVRNFKRAISLYAEHLLKIVRLDLKTGFFEEIRVHPTVACCEGEFRLSSWTKMKVDGKFVHPDDKDLYLEKMNLSYLQTFFKTHDILSFRYREYIRSDYRFVCLFGQKAKEYTGNSKIVYFYLSDIHDVEVKEFEQLQKFQMQASKASDDNQMKTLFLSQMSHDLKNSLNVVLGLTNLCLKDTSNSEKMFQHLWKIKNSTDDLLVLINDILEVSMMGRKASLKYNEFSLEAMILDLSEEIKMMFPQVSFSYRFSLKHKRIISDHLQLKRILNNLLVNSCKYTKDFQKPILICVEERDPADSVAEYIFDIRDFGVGMSAEVLSKLFLPFERGTNTKDLPGHGLGMTIVENLVQRLDGTITVDSEEGIGTTYHLSFPFRFVAEGNLSQLKNKKILVAEDYVVNHYLLQEIFKEKEICCDFAEDGQKAIQLFESNQYDLVLMDVHMPLMDGFETTKKIRLLNRKIPIIALSADTYENDVEKILACGMNDYVTKPIEPQELWSVLAKYV